MKKELSADSLKMELWETLQDLKAGRVDYRDALAVAHTAKGITSIVKTQLNIAILSGTKPDQRLITFNSKK